MILTLASGLSLCCLPGFYHELREVTWPRSSSTRLGNDTPRAVRDNVARACREDLRLWGPGDPGLNPCLRDFRQVVWSRSPHL